MKSFYTLTSVLAASLIFTACSKEAPEEVEAPVKEEEVSASKARLEDTKEHLSAIADNAKEQAAETYEAAKESTKEVAGKVAEKAVAAKDATVEKTAELVEEASLTAAELKEKAKTGYEGIFSKEDTAAEAASDTAVDSE